MMKLPEQQRITAAIESIGCLHPVDSAALAAIFQRYAGLPFKLDGLNEMTTGRLSGADLRAAIPLLIQQGFLFSVKKIWGERLFYIPFDLLSSLQERYTVYPIELSNKVDIDLYKESKRGLAYDLFRILAWIEFNGLPVTVKGTPYQKALNKMEGQIHLTAEDIVGLSLYYTDQDVYSPHIAVVFDMLMKFDLIDKEQREWRLNTVNLRSWLELDIQEMNSAIFRQLLLRYVPSDAVLQHFVFRTASSDLSCGVWYGLQDVLTSLRRQGILKECISKEQDLWMRSWLTALCGFGWLELGYGQEEQLYLRWLVKPRFTKEMEFPKQQLIDAEALSVDMSEINISIAMNRHPRSGRCHIQPDFEILVPPDVSFEVRWVLEAFSDNITMDTMSVYQINRSSVTLAARQGLSSKEILAVLHEQSSGVPNNVRLAIEQWSREIEQIIIPEKQRSWSKDHKTVDTTFVGVISGVTGLPVEQGWIFSGRDYKSYERDDVIPTTTELFPGLEDIPVIWFKEMRDYHVSTARKIIAQALTWHTKIELQIQGETVEYLPLTLIGEESWKMKGVMFTMKDSIGVEHVLAPGEWEALRLIIPDIKRKMLQ
ncbi:hypothetical protein EJP82_05585 [Paenibacillus anaericanus]|uniref:Helicase XPB/Ssl2 N-terminal domain-containing protein n=1 Tax=Paenibacillus anaericanus TaxID=170367 RepID=A0A433YD94_9BACL|nr:helicase-associated domain-containing protein [Paenibacillus anaericanus]RUT47850.1 hypothetical protein EJP82_05585 [Paenibacillus anaericanus]